MGKQKVEVEHVDGEAPAAPNKIKIIGLSIQKTRFKIQGTDILVMHQFSEKAKKEMGSKQRGEARQKKENKDPNAEFNGARYVIEGKDAIPAIAIKKAIVSAATQADLFKTEIRTALFVRGDLQYGQFCEIKSDGPTMREDVVRVGPSKVADLRYRPEYQGWSVEFEVSWNSRILSLEQVANLINIAGFGIGLGENRPEKTGDTWGRFELATAA